MSYRNWKVEFRHISTLISEFKNENTIRGLCRKYKIKIERGIFDYGKLKYIIHNPPKKKRLKDYLTIDSTSYSGLRWKRKYNNKLRKGNEAFTSKDMYGYYVGGFDGKLYQAHQVIMFLAYGEWSNRHKQCDHIDGDKSNNNINNLRFVSPTGNQRNANRKINSNNKTGIKGLERIKQHGYSYWRSRHAGDILYTGNNKQIALERLEKARKDDPYYID